MAKEKCELLNDCGFFRKYQESLDLACRGFIKVYCMGPKMDECERKRYRNANGSSPHDDMMPNGKDMPDLLRRGS